MGYLLSFQLIPFTNHSYYLMSIRILAGIHHTLGALCAFFSRSCKNHARPFTSSFKLVSSKAIIHIHGYLPPDDDLAFKDSRILLKSSFCLLVVM